MVSIIPLNISRHIILILLFLNNLLITQANVLQEPVKRIPGVFTHEEMVRGERLFHGLVYLENDAMKCSHCHNTTYSDSLNWNPDAIEISRKYLNLTSDDLARVLLKPSGKKMAESHNSIKLSSEEIILIKAYMDELSHEELVPRKIEITNLLIFIAAFLLILFAIADLIVIKKLSLWLNFAILTLTGVVVTYYLVIEGINLGHSPGYTPDQPVKFSHLIHAGQNQTDCIYCHSDAPYSKAAGITPENVCMNCHLIVRNGTRSGNFEISKLLTAYENKMPIEWTRVYSLPDHVYFNHAQHVTSGAIECQTCHGPVEEIDRIGLAQKMTMGWCVNCHRSTAVKFGENNFFSQYTGLNERVRRGEARADSITIDKMGGIECMKCHY